MQKEKQTPEHGRYDNGSRYRELTASIARRVLPSEMMVSIEERQADREEPYRVQQKKYLVRQPDLAAWICCDEYDVIPLETSETKDNIFLPLKKSGSFRDYLEEQIQPFLCGTPEQRERTIHSLQMDHVTAQLSSRDVYVVNFSCEIGGKICCRRFDFYAVDPQRKTCIVLGSDTTRQHRQREDSRGPNLFSGEELISQWESRTLRAPAQFDLSGRRVLLARDQLLDAHIVKEMLAMEGVEVDVAGNGKIALDMFEEMPEFYYDTILMDERLPVMDAAEAAQAIRALKRRDSRIVPILGLTDEPVEPEALFYRLRGRIWAAELRISRQIT